MKKQIFLIAFLMSINFIIFNSGHQIYAQEIISSAGEYAEAQDVQLSWTLGEPVISTISASSNTLTQGFHQGTLVLTQVLVNHVDFKIKVYPNPLIKKVIINTGTNRKFNYELYNEDGKIIMKNVLESEFNEIDMEALANGIYYLKIIDKNNLISSFKLIKIY